jgi:hypothetical protein
MKKLVSLNVGLEMIIRDGKEDRIIQFTGVLPSRSFAHPSHMLAAMCEFINDEFGTDFYLEWGRNATISILKPKRISRPVVDTEKTIKELMP